MDPTDIHRPEEKEKKKSEEKKEEWKTPEERRNAFREAGDGDSDMKSFLIFFICFFDDFLQGSRLDHV